MASDISFNGSASSRNLGVRNCPSCLCVGCIFAASKGNGQVCVLTGCSFPPYDLCAVMSLSTHTTGGCVKGNVHHPYELFMFLDASASAGCKL